jgi:hypothetical protein
MAIDLGPLASLGALAVSAAVGGVTTWLALGKRREEAGLARATRRTSALQLLTDEEFTLTRVRDECRLIQATVQLRQARLGVAFEALRDDAERILRESRALLAGVRERRRGLEPRIQALPAVEIEAVIASAYHGKRLAEAQLERTLRSRDALLKASGLVDEA